MTEDQYTSVFGGKMPDAIRLLLDKINQVSLPARIERINGEHIYSLEHLLDVALADTHRPQAGLFLFAVSPDGAEVMVDVRDEAFPVVLDESGDLWKSGFFLEDLLAARWIPLA